MVLLSPVEEIVESPPEDFHEIPPERLERIGKYINQFFLDQLIVFDGFVEHLMEINIDDVILQIVILLLSSTAPLVTLTLPPLLELWILNQ